MSGGYFDYAQYSLVEVEEQLETLLKNVRDDEYYESLSEDVLKIIEETYRLTKLARIYIHRLDWYLSGDDGEETLISRLEEDLKGVENGRKK